MDNMTEKQKRFCEYYLETGNATEAARKAGYKQPNVQGSQNLEKLSIKQYIENRQKEADEKRIADTNEVLEYLTKVLRGEEKDQFGLDASLQDRTKAAELLAKRYRIFDIKDNKSLSEIEKDKEKLELEYKKLQNEKLKAEIARVKGEDNTEVTDDGFIKALGGKVSEVWNEEE